MTTKQEARDMALRSAAFTKALLHKDQEGLMALMPTDLGEAMQLLVCAHSTVLYLVDEREEVLDALLSAQQLAGSGPKEAKP